MTEGDKAFYKRRIREEVNKAKDAPSPELRQLHLRWATLYQERLDGTPRAITKTLEARLVDAGFDPEQLMPAKLRQPGVLLKAS